MTNYEYCKDSNFTGTGTITNPSYLYDNPTAGTTTTQYNTAGDTTAVKHSTTALSTLYTATSAGLGSKTQTWATANLIIKWDILTEGDGDNAWWDSYATLTYTTDGTTYINTGLSTPSAFSSFGPGFCSGDTGGLPSGPFRDVISISTGVTPANCKVKSAIRGHAKTSDGMGGWIMASIAYIQIYEFYIEATYTTGPTVTNLNSNSYCNIGSTYNITGSGFTGSTAVSINGVSASFSVTNATTISVTIPAMSSYGAVTVSVTNGTAGTCTGYINTPTISISAPATGGSCFNSSNTTCTASVTNLASTTINWTCSGGSFSPTSTTSGGSTTWTAPASPSSNGAAYTITATAAGNGSTVASITRYVYYVPTVTSFTANLGASGSAVINGTGILLSWATSNATAVTSNFGSAAASYTNYTVTPTSWGGATNGYQTTTYTITPTNAAGSGSTSSYTVYDVYSPTASMSASTTSPLYGATNVTLTTSNTNNTSTRIGTTGNGSFDINVGGIGIGSMPHNYPSQAVQASGFVTATTYYNSAGSPASGVFAYSNVTITPQTVTMSAPTPNGNYTLVNNTRVFTAGTVGGAVNTTVNWTATGGSFSPTSTASGGTTTWTAPAGAGTVTIYNTAAANGSTQSSCTVYVESVPVAAISASTTLAVAGATNVTISTTCASNYYLKIGTTGNGSSDIVNYSATPTNVTLYGVQSSGFAATKTYTVSSGSYGGSWSYASVTITLQPAPTFTNNGPVLFGTNVTLTPTFSGTVPTVSPGSWSTWSSGVGQTVTLNRNTLYTLTQSGVGTATTVPQAKLGASTVSLNDVRTITANTGAISINGSYARVLTGTATNAQISFLQLRNTYLSTAYYF